MKGRMLVVGLLALAAVGCENRRQKAIEKVDHDREVLRRAQAAVNEVIRNSPDCAVARPLMTEAYQRIEDSRQEVSVPASQQTLDTMKVQVDRVAQACP
jgi:hypothetical protein